MNGYFTEPTGLAASKPAIINLARISKGSHPIFVISITVSCYEKNE
jgi:hypothetical protein